MLNAPVFRHRLVVDLSRSFVMFFVRFMYIVLTQFYKIPSSFNGGFEVSGRKPSKNGAISDRAWESSGAVGEEPSKEPFLLKPRSDYGPESKANRHSSFSRRRNHQNHNPSFSLHVVSGHFSLCIGRRLIRLFSFTTIATIAYTESTSDTEWDKFKGALLNSLVYVAVVTVVTFLLLLLFYFGCTKFLKYYMGFSAFLVLGFMGVAMSLYDLAAVLLPVGPLRLLVDLAISRDEDILALVYEARPIIDPGNTSIVQRRVRRETVNPESQTELFYPS
ncbi:hypothetical protein L1887_18082 [Cichorium endivia]|nr:hypothetical protein L1887_18082 [Cichorium endivia]